MHRPRRVGYPTKMQRLVAIAGARSRQRLLPGKRGPCTVSHGRGGQWSHARNLSGRCLWRPTTPDHTLSLGYRVATIPPPNASRACADLHAIGARPLPSQSTELRRNMSNQVASQRTITPRGATVVGLASVLSALSGYLILVIAARILGPVSNADFLVFWSLLFGMFGIVSGLQQETTRSVRSAGLSPVTAQRPVHVLHVGLLVGIGAAVLVGATSPMWSAQALGPRSWPLVVALCLAVPASAGNSVVVGALSGQRSWHACSALVSCDATVRLLLVALVAFAGAKGRGLEMASAAAAGVWMVFILVSPAGRRAAHATGDSDRGQFLSRTGHAMVAAASSAVLVVGFPVLLRLTSSNVEWLTAAPLLLAISLTRAPLLLPLNAYQGVAIAHFLSERDRGIAVLLRPAAAVLGVGALSSAAAYFVGPFIMTTFFGPDYHVDGRLLAGLTLAAACLALLTLTGAATLAHGRHKSYATGWFLSSAASVALITTDLPLASRSVLSLGVGPLLGIGIHLAGVRSATRRPADINEGTGGHWNGEQIDGRSVRDAT